jgi:hypothetical protein
VLGARPVRAAAGHGAAAVTLVACASVWGFEPAGDKSDIAADATSAAGSSSLPDSTPPGNGEAPGDPGDVAAFGASVQATDGAFANVAVDAEPDGGGATEDGDPDGAEPPVACNAACVPVPPTGWSGPYAIYEGSASAASPDCARAGGYPNDVYDGYGMLDAGATECTCTCRPVTGASCGSPVIHFFSDPNCMAACSPASQVVDSTCTVLNVGSCGGLHITLEAGAPSGSCEPVAVATVPAPTWQTSARLCGPSSPATGSGCAVGSLCVPATGLPFEGSYCVAQTAETGPLPCPPSYPAVRAYSESFVDTRGCSTCSCGPATGIECTATFEGYGNANCKGGPMMMPPPSACSGGGIQSAMTTGGAPTGGTCAPSGVQPTGTLQAANPTTTVCCTR